MKKLVLIISLCSIFVFSVITYASKTSSLNYDTETNINLIEEITEELNDIEIENFNINENNRCSNLVINENLFGANGSATYSFSTAKEQPYYRVFIENTGNSSIKANINGNILTIEKGQSKTVSFKSSSSYGRRNVDITSIDGFNLSGYISVSVSSDILEAR